MRNQDPTAANLEPRAPMNGSEARLSPPGAGSAGQSEAEASSLRPRKDRTRREAGPTLRAVREDCTILLNFYLFDTPQRLSILHDMEASGRKSSLDASILGAIEEGLRSEEALYGQETEWEGRGKGIFAAEAREVGGRLDRSLSSLASIIASVRDSFPADHPRSEAADRLGAALFPNGVGAITKQGFKVEHATVAVLLKRAREEQAQRDLAALGLQPQVERIAELHQEFGEAVRLGEVLDYEEMQRLRRQGQQALSMIIFRIVGRYHGADEASVATREEMLRSVIYQNERLRRSYRRGQTADGELDEERGGEEQAAEEIA